MNHKVDELAKGLAQSVNRRQALKRFGVGLAGMALACFGLTSLSAAGTKRTGNCLVSLSFSGRKSTYAGYCVDPNTCQIGVSTDCPVGGPASNTTLICGNIAGGHSCSF